MTLRWYVNECFIANCGRRNEEEERNAAGIFLHFTHLLVKILDKGQRRIYHLNRELDFFFSSSLLSMANSWYSLVQHSLSLSISRAAGLIITTSEFIFSSCQPVQTVEQLLLVASIRVMDGGRRFAAAATQPQQALPSNWRPSINRLLSRLCVCKLLLNLFDDGKRSPEAVRICQGKKREIVFAFLHHRFSQRQFSFFW